MKARVMHIVEEMCAIEYGTCKGKNLFDLAEKLLKIAGIPQEADIQEVPLAEENQVVILFFMPNDKNYYSLFSGIDNDGDFCIELSIVGAFGENDIFNFYENDIILPLDFFQKNRNEEEKNIKEQKREQPQKEWWQ